MSRIIQSKLERIRSGKKPRVLDLFAGCGGISLGFHAAGFENIGAVEFDPPAAESHAMNFHADKPAELYEAHAMARDISLTEPDELLHALGNGKEPEQEVDVIVGGPPCQSFARVGRAKLREVAEHPSAYLQDPRGNLYLRYLHYVTALKPIALLMENVPDVLNYGGHNIAEEVCEALDDLGYDARYTMLNAVFYGVPEMRERMFLVAYRKEIQATGWFPEPSHWIDLPRGYHGSRQVAMKTIKPDLLKEEGRYFVPPPEPERDGLLPAVTAFDALSDLMPIGDDSEQKRRKGPRRFDRFSPYRTSVSLTPYQRLMRNWPGFEAGEGVVDHVIRYLPRDYKIFARMQPGDQYPEAYSLALRMFDERLTEIERMEGQRLPEGSQRYNTEKANFVPPYDSGKFPNKWRKMEADQPARTLMAHLGKDSYSHIHYDSAQARTISVREAARLQSFPDGFKFQGPMNPAFRQIGNAVPPLMAKALAETMIAELSEGANDAETACAETVNAL